MEEIRNSFPPCWACFFLFFLCRVSLALSLFFAFFIPSCSLIVSLFYLFVLFSYFSLILPIFPYSLQSWHSHVFPLFVLNCGLGGSLGLALLSRTKTYTVQGAGCLWLLVERPAQAARTQPDANPSQLWLAMNCGRLCVELRREAESKKAPL